jgi:hypothetical protein
VSLIYFKIKLIIYVFVIYYRCLVYLEGTHTIHGLNSNFLLFVDGYSILIQRHQPKKPTLVSTKKFKVDLIVVIRARTF